MYFWLQGHIPAKYKSWPMDKFDILQLAHLKEILYETYTNIKDKITYQNITVWVEKYVSLINKGISEEGYVIRERLLENLDTRGYNEASITNNSS